MPRPLGDSAPREYTDAPEAWLDAALVEDSPVSAIYAVEFAKRLRAAVRASGLSLRAIEARSGVSRKTIERVLAGQVLPTFGAIARLEEFFDADLWPGRDLRAR